MTWNRMNYIDQQIMENALVQEFTDLCACEERCPLGYDESEIADGICPCFGKECYNITEEEWHAFFRGDYDSALKGNFR